MLFPTEVGYNQRQPQSIWYKRNWWATVKSVFDGLFYGLMTGAILGWTWPR